MAAWESGVRGVRVAGWFYFPCIDAKSLARGGGAKYQGTGERFLPAFTVSNPRREADGAGRDAPRFAGFFPLLTVFPLVVLSGFPHHHPLLCSFHPAGPGQGEPARGGVHQRPAAAQPHPSQDRGDGSPRDPALRDLPAAAGLPRLRLQNPLQVPGDGLDPARGHRRQQAQGECHAGAERNPPAGWQKNSDFLGGGGVSLFRCSWKAGRRGRGFNEAAVRRLRWVEAGAGLKAMNKLK